MLIRRAILLAAVTLPAHAQQPAEPSMAAKLCGQLATNWATALTEQDRLQVQIAQMQQQLALAARTPPATAPAAPQAAPEPSHP